MNLIYILHWEGDDGWDFVGAYPSISAAEKARDGEIASDGGDHFEYHITCLGLKGSK